MELSKLFEKRGYNKEQFISAVESSISKRNALIQLGLVPSGGNYKVFDRAVNELGLDISHFRGQGYLLGGNHDWTPKIPLDEILVENSSYSSSSRLKQRLYDVNLLKPVCNKCGIGDKWNGSSLSLHLEHKNGDNSDHRIENLEILCPNCHSQTLSYCGRNKGKYST